MSSLEQSKREENLAKEQENGQEKQESLPSCDLKSSTEKSNSDVPTHDGPINDDTKTPNTNEGDAAGEETKLSKNQLKKRKRWEQKMEVKKRRKQQEKEVKSAKAKAQGRDLEQERKEMEARTASGEGWRKRQAVWEKKMKQASSTFQVCIDCSFGEQMTAKEINSLALQLRYCYASNRRSPQPCFLTATSVTGTTLDHLKNVSGFEEWSTKGFTCTDNSLEEHYKSKLSSVVYLTSDSDNVLNILEDDKVYVVGGIVDRNRLKRAAIDRAESLGIATAKLPLDAHLQEMESTRVLTTNHVYDILLKYKELFDRKSSKAPWREALMAVLPNRKGAKFASEEEEKSKEAS
mmetsp:Transcript_16048/g.20986  ORF Transcript_16048/g.20986 Transcript_16048/m.20986 type:complete len:349 (-) Transcript_16048:238-1284(-)|eukprot:CAMPEP_0198141574 /NCGR_PEP_ID=MMETSP1443-20131203/4565_1 /TAXON_ID=186043 /ORGANISM="Entomoneis sp., Strain CCMP2396" /LENGTH=348 /DNA_ID=CAMNT_0043804367 /DNA_START=30 /DNA_END=1076 /DNA_ORIENTATION=-